MQADRALLKALAGVPASAKVRVEREPMTRSSARQARRVELAARDERRRAYVEMLRKRARARAEREQTETGRAERKVRKQRRRRRGRLERVRANR